MHYRELCPGLVAAITTCQGCARQSSMALQQIAAADGCFICHLCGHTEVLAPEQLRLLRAIMDGSLRAVPMRWVMKGV